jgi:hypothetical protein
VGESVGDVVGEFVGECVAQTLFLIPDVVQRFSVILYISE